MIRCARCSEPLDGNETSTVEAFEVTGELLCDSCADEVFVEEFEADDD